MPRDLRTINCTDGQKLESDEMIKRIGDISYRNMGTLSRIGLMDSGKALITSGLRVVPSTGMTVSVPSGAGLQRFIDVIPFIQTSAQTITLDSATGVARTDIIEAQVKVISDKTDYAQSATVASGTGVSISNEEIKRDIKYYLSARKVTGTTTATPATAGTLTGTVAIAGTIDLSEKYLLNLSDGEDGSFQEIDCRGATPEATSLAEINTAINTAVGRTMASVGGGDVSILTGIGTGQTSYFTIKPPNTDADKDCLEIVFGVSAGGVYKYTYSGTNEWFKLAEIDVGTATTTITTALIRNIEKRSTWASQGSDVIVSEPAFTKLESLANGWNPASETWTYDSADSPTFGLTISGDKRSKYSKGMKFRLEQDEALTSYWSFDSDLTDGVGSNDGTAIGGASVGAGGKFGNGITLNGTDQAVSITDDTSLKPTGDFTIGAWIKANNAGVTSWIFQSYSDNTNANGIRLYITTENFLCFGVGDNSASDSYTITGTTEVQDNAWHYVVLTVKENWCQIYLDGNLEASGYVGTPTYSTNYVRIGVSDVAGSSVAGTWFAGVIDDIFLINGYALDEETIREKYEAGTAQGVADVTIQKKFLLTGIDYDGSNTTLTLYGGTDFALSNSAIANPYFSIVQQPYNFNRNPDKWSVILEDNTSLSVTTPTVSLYYNIGSLTITAPIGEWVASLTLFVGASRTVSGSLSAIATLSTDNGTTLVKLNPRQGFISEALSPGVFCGCSSEVSFNFETKESTPVFLMIKTADAGSDPLVVYGQLATTVIKFTSVWL